MKRKILQIWKALTQRPFYVAKYGKQFIVALINYCVLTIRGNSRSNFTIGENPRVLSFNAFKVEKPNAKISVGNSLIVYHNCDVLVTDKGYLEIGDNCIIGSNFRLYCKDRITLGNAVLISWNVFISDYDGHPQDPNSRFQEILYMQESFFPSFKKQNSQINKDNDYLYKPNYTKKPVTIEDNVWIGANVTILKGVHIGSGSIIAAGSIVTKDVPQNTVVAGNPAKAVKELSKTQKSEY